MRLRLAADYVPTPELELPASVPEWHRDAACSDVDPETFFPDRGRSSKAAKTLCSDCPVQRECLEHALENAEEFGIWGGTSERERRAIRAERRQERLSA